MIKWGASAATVGFAYLCEHPLLVAGPGLQADLSGQKWVTSFYKYVYIALASCYALIHKQQPSHFVDQLAQFQWIEDRRDAKLLAEIQVVLNELVDMQTTPVTLPEFQTQLAEMHQAVLGADFKDWHDLGFQGKNPETDFRGAGSLGLVLFHNFCTRYTEECRRLVAESRSSTSETAHGPWYPLALVSIRLSMALCELFKREKVLVYGLWHHKQWLRAVETIHAAVLLDFHTRWMHAVSSGVVKTYFDCELVLKGCEKRLPVSVYKLLIN